MYTAQLAWVVQTRGGPSLAEVPMNPLLARRAVLALLVCVSSLFCAACETTGEVIDEGEPVVMEEGPVPEEVAEVPADKSTGEAIDKNTEGEVPLVVAESERPASVSPRTGL